jgi:hydrogenase expression/formation protein HypC
MCIGTPMRVVACEGCFAWCEAGPLRERLDMTLVGAQAVGTWVMGYLGTARQVLDDLEAARSIAARGALSAALHGDGNLDAFFADLVGREPQLPAHLRRDPAPAAPQ